jgi:hypothetical protein
VFPPVAPNWAKDKAGSARECYPAAAVYVRDPDGHLLEYLAMLEEEPRPDLGIVPFSQWRS